MSMSTEAWIKKGGERQQLIEEMVRSSYRKQDDIGNVAYHLGVASAVIEYLKRRRRGEQNPKVRLSKEESHCELFFGGALEKINQFARSEAEKDVLLVQFLEKMIGMGVSRFYGELVRQEQMEPEKIFHAPSAMTRVKDG